MGLFGEFARSVLAWAYGMSSRLWCLLYRAVNYYTASRDALRKARRGGLRQS